MAGPFEPRRSRPVPSDAKHIFLVAGEPSGDQLGGKLMAALKRQEGHSFTWSGVGGEAMALEGLNSLFPLSDVSVMGPFEILKSLRGIVKRVYQTVDAAITAQPDLVVIIDSPEFTHPIAKRIRRRAPHIPVIDYVSPSVWAWRPGRARKMRRYVDHVMALLPFEPPAHERLGGPPCSYVGHPLIERLDEIRSNGAAALRDRLGIGQQRPVLLVLPGSRRNEVSRLMASFGETVGYLAGSLPPFDIIIPVVGAVRKQIEQEIQTWPVQPHLVSGEADKFAGFAAATAALAASGTVTLELALAGVPMVVAYRVDAVSARLKWLVNVRSIVLANLVLDENIFPEFIQEDCRADNLCDSLLPLFGETGQRAGQVAAFAEIEKNMRVSHGSPSDHAAKIVLDHL